MLALSVFAILAAAAILRIWSLDARGVGHIEMYTPNIPLPAGISDPPPRMTLISTFTGSLWEPHPPAWYLLNWPWTKLFGTSPAALRFPSVLVGVLAVWLLWRFAVRERSALTGAFAAALFAMHGLHIMWSQLSRPVVLVSALGIASSLVLLRLASSQTPRRILPWYVILTLAGLATDHYYWFLLAGQVVWVFQLAGKRPVHWGGLLGWQFLTMAVASPLVTLAVAQGRESYLAANVLRATVDYVGLGFLFSSVESTAPFAAWMPVAAAALGIVLAGIGFIQRSSAGEPIGIAHLKQPGTKLVWATVALASVVVAGWAFILARAGMESIGRLLPTVAMPTVFVAAGYVVPFVPRWVRPPRPFELSTVLCTVPAAIVLVLSTIVPLVDDKYFLLFTPFLLVLVAEGVATLLATARGVASRIAVMATLGLVTLLLVNSIRFYRGVDATPIDFRGLASQLRPELNESDQVLVFKHYAMTPLFYYLGLDPSRYVGTNHAAVRQSGPGRFWLISLRDTEIPDPKSFQEAASGCVLTQTLTARRIRAERYERCER